MQNPFVIVGLGGRRHGDEGQDNEQVPAYAVVLVNGLGLINAAEHGREVKLAEANQNLDDQQDVGDEAENGVRRLEVGAIVVYFVVLDDDEAGDESKEGGPVESGVDVGAELLLLLGVGGL